VTRNIVHFRAIAEKWGAGLKEHVKRALAAPYIPSSSSLVESVVTDLISPVSAKDEGRFYDTDEVDEVIVDRLWSEDVESEADSDAAETASSRHDPSEADSDAPDVRPQGFWALPPFAFARIRIWPVIRDFYMPRFEEEEERLYQKECWGQAKRPSLWASVFFIATCVLAIVTIQNPIVLADKVREFFPSEFSLFYASQIFYYGVSPLLSVPILFMCAYNFPYDRPFFYQTFLCVSTWSLPFYEILYAFLCGFYSPHPYQHHLFTCGSKDFLSTFYYTSALQAVALFGTSLKRLPATIGALAFLILCAAVLFLRIAQPFFFYGLHSPSFFISRVFLAS
jgi:hypothetical protein